MKIKHNSLGKLFLFCISVLDNKRFSLRNRRKYTIEIVVQCIYCYPDVNPFVLDLKVQYL